MGFGLTMLAEGAGAPAVVSASDFEGITTALSTQINVTTIVGVLSACIGAVVGICFLYWGIRKVVRMMMSALKRGKLKI
jgi:hypothetical protein